MKKLLLLPVLLFITIFSFAQSLESVVKPGAKLIYAVESGEQKYNFIVTIKALVPALIFDWEMTAPINTSGTITHTPTAMVSANTMYNYFKPGAKTLDDNSISVWLSKNTFAGLMAAGKGAMVKMNAGDAPKIMGTSSDSKELQIIINGEKETIEEELATELNNNGLAASDEFFTFYKSAKLPIILRMRNGFYIALKEIKTK